jgi:hypothetical protein
MARNYKSAVLRAARSELFDVRWGVGSGEGQAQAGLTARTFARMLGSRPAAGFTSAASCPAAFLRWSGPSPQLIQESVAADVRRLRSLLLFKSEPHVGCYGSAAILNPHPRPPTTKLAGETRGL